MNDVTTLIPVSELIPMLTVISNRNWDGFKELEKEFVTKYGVEAWQDFFAYRLKPALDKDSDRWLLVQWCSQGYTVQAVV
jgi:hypothetical protein